MTACYFIISLFVVCVANGSFIRSDENSNVIIQSDPGKNVTINGVDVVGEITVLNQTGESLLSLSTQHHQTLSEQSSAISLLREEVDMQTASLSEQVQNISWQSKNGTPSSEKTNAL